MNVFAVNAEMLILCLLFLCALFGFNLRYWHSQLINPLSVIYAVAILGCVLEIGAFYAEGKPSLIWLNYLTNILYMSCIGILGAAMLYYCNEQFPKPIWHNKKQRHTSMIPVMLELLVLASTPLTGLVFTVDAAGYYHRSGTFFLQLIPYGYLLITTVQGIYWFIRSQTTTERSRYLSIAMFAIPPFLLGAVQIFVNDNTLDILMFSITLSLMCNYAVSQNSRITRDTLTRLPNREVLDVVLLEKMRSSRKGEKDDLYLFYCDMDGFKSINDTYGHPEGDRALVLTADTLYAVCHSYKATAARIGGDEFAIVLEAPNEDVPKALIRDVEAALKKVSEGEKFSLRISMGYTKYRPGETISDLLRAGDRELYRVKRTRKARHNQHVFLSEEQL